MVDDIAVPYIAGVLGVPEHLQNLEGFRKEDRKRDDQSITTGFGKLPTTLNVEIIA